MGCEEFQAGYRISDKKPCDVSRFALDKCPVTCGACNRCYDAYPVRIVEHPLPLYAGKRGNDNVYTFIFTCGPKTART